MLKEKTGKNIEVMVYGDGAFKDPVGKIWELADPVVSPGYTDGLEGTPNEVKLKYLADNDFSNLKGQELQNAIKKYIKEKTPVLLAVCFDNPDHVGHAAGHDTPEYYAKLNELDTYVARIVQAVKDAGMFDNTIFIITADHGGINKGHGGKTMQEMETPFIICGKNVKKGGEFSESMMQYDVASTIAYIFGLKQPQVWIGRPMKQVFK